MYELRDFEKDVIERSREVPVVVDFWAPWCGPCKMLGPVLEEMAGEAGGRWELVKVNTEDHPQMALDYEVTGIPDVRLFRDGKAVAEFKGFLPAAEIAEWLKPWLPSPRESELMAARALAAEGKLAEAIAAANPVLADEPDNERVRVEIAEWELREAPGAVARRLARIDATSDHFDKASAMIELGRFLEATAGIDESGFAAGRDALKQGDYGRWIDAWLEALEQDRNALEGRLLGAGKAAFRFLGARHPVAEENYRRFTFLLY